MKGFRQLLAGYIVVAAASAALADDGDCRGIVGFKGSADREALEDGGVEVEEVRGKVASGTVKAGKIAKLRANPSVAYVEEDSIVEALRKPSGGKPSGGGTPAAQTTPWGVTKVWGGTSPSVTGSGVKVSRVKVAIIDTGIDLTQPDLEDNIKGNVTFVPRTSSGKDDNGHGGVAPASSRSAASLHAAGGPQPSPKLRGRGVLPCGVASLERVAERIGHARRRRRGFPGLRLRRSTPPRCAVHCGRHGPNRALAGPRRRRRPAIREQQPRPGDRRRDGHESERPAPRMRHPWVS